MSFLSPCNPTFARREFRHGQRRLHTPCKQSLLQKKKGNVGRYRSGAMYFSSPG
jgi:hypothetical protein